MALNSKGFDLWADGYDKDVLITDENNRYPFAGYKDLLNFIYNMIRNKDHAKILDIGIGTGVLSTKLYELNYDITGVDFSKKMLEITKNKMPNAKLIQWDFSKGLPVEIKDDKFDFVISTYALHHLKDDAKVKFLGEISTLIKSNGTIIIGDVSFKTRDDLITCKNDCGDYWDHDEYYFVADEIIEALNNKYNCDYIKVSHCAGILVLTSV